MDTKKRREDGRNNNELRPLAIEQGLLNAADGSARFMHGRSSVLVGVYGPAPSKLQSKEEADRAILTVHFKPQKGLAGPREKEYEMILRQTFESVVLLSKFPRAAISINVQVIEDHGSILSTAINATNLCLMDAGIPMSNFVSAMTTGIFSNGDISLDLTDNEEKTCTAVFTFVNDLSSEGVITSLTSGLFSEEQYFACAEASRRGAESVRAFVRLSQQKRYEKTSS